MTTQLHSFKSLFTTTMLLLFASLVEAANISSTAAGGNWSSTTSWVGGMVPGSGDNVTIVGNSTITVDINNAACATLIINSATNNQTGTLSFLNTSSVLTVSGNVTIGGTGNRQGSIDMTNGGILQIGGAVTLGSHMFTAGTGTVEYTGANPTIASLVYQNLRFSGTGTAGAGGTLTIQGNLTNTGGGTLDFGGNNVILSGTTATNNIAGFTTTGSVSMTKTAGTAFFTGNVNGTNLVINGAGGTLNLGPVLTHTFSGNWTRTAGTLMGGSSILKIAGNASGTGAAFTAGTSTVEYNGAGPRTVAPVTYFNLTLSNSGARTVTGSTVNGTLSMRGTATAAGTSPIFGGSSTLEYAGSSAQTSTNVEFPASTGPFNLRINNTNGVTLHAARTIDGAVTFSNGILNTTLTNLLTFNSEATSSASSNTSFVNGPVRKIFDAGESFTFPIGVTGTGNEPLGIPSGAALNDDFTAQYLRSSATALGGTLPPILNVSACDYWVLTKNSAPAANVSLVLSWDANSPCNTRPFVTDPATLTIGHFNGSAWDEAGTSGSFTGNVTAGTITRNNVTAFSPFSLANTQANQNPLPVTFGNIKGYAKNGGIQIDWTIYTEHNVDHYEIERSVNGVQQFTTIGQIAARNTNNQTEYGWLDATPVNGINFYRIKTVDLDSKISYSIIVRVNLILSAEDIVIYPNPAQKGYVSFQAGNLHRGNYTLKIINSSGQEIHTQKFVHEGGALSQTISLPTGIKSGMYNLQLINGNEIKSKAFIVQ
jgi:type IX secretion system substrate protein